MFVVSCLLSRVCFVFVVSCLTFVLVFVVCCVLCVACICSVVLGVYCFLWSGLFVVCLFVRRLTFVVRCRVSLRLRSRLFVVVGPCPLCMYCVLCVVCCLLLCVGVFLDCWCDLFFWGGCCLLFVV